MNSNLEKEFFNQLLPLGNTPATRAMVAVEVNPTGGVLNLNDVFGPTGGAGHFYEFKAANIPSGSALYVAVSANPTYGVKPGNIGSSASGGAFTGMGWPMFNGDVIRGRMPYVGAELRPTLVPYAGYKATLIPAPYVHWRGSHQMPTGGTLHIRQSSLDPGGNAGDPGGFPAAY